MISLLTRKIHYQHLKMIHQNVNGLPKNRLQKTADKWVRSLRHQKIKTYYDVFLNREDGKYDIRYYISEKQDQEIKRVKSAIQPNIAKLHQQVNVIKPQRVDDTELTRNIEELTFEKFIEQGKNSPTNVHILAASIIAAIVVHAFLYFMFLHGKDLPKSQRVRVLNAQITQTYSFENQEHQIKKIKERIQIVNQEYLRVLNEARLEKNRL